jgi:hypothetical protein
LRYLEYDTLSCQLQPNCLVVLAYFQSTDGKSICQLDENPHR